MQESCEFLIGVTDAEIKNYTLADLSFKEIISNYFLLFLIYMKSA